jgi:ribonuclease HI/probable phosphoglycerate mutase
MLGAYKVKHPGLIPLYQQACRLAAQVGHVTYEHVRRELNTEADRLSNLGMDQNRGA